ncbi:hypothetical protein AMAG_19180 [Allomyces macrogynus ATCC 38327]|uniref:Kinesin motor domain-containing protein n=1 Tax=Allomyces macrogynus (strain ATCC 38327) TaxID=578462 RepID=A0A0L0SST4_ALLM3|nr:hypothetical protein AMAG_19180 [Allomyces macrogynus ATCC 38327]|eukprot:KNE65567.1 hypothetical protein AMAG_19180 [Allomyces macrogynus ATCC 38327]
MAADSRNIKVFVRCRPINDKERREHAQGVAILRFPPAPIDEQDTVPGVGRAIAIPTGVTTQSAMATLRTYTFDRVFTPTVDQDTVFRSVMLPILDQVLAGFPCTVFAYGQTSSGKTHTMEGHLDLDADGQLSPHAGLIPRTLSRLFDTLEPSRGVSISCLEIYNEVLRDLLAADGARCDLTLYEDKRTASVIVQGLTDHPVTSPVDALILLQRASERRSIAATLMNQHSSRSHCVVTVTTQSTLEYAHRAKNIQELRPKFSDRVCRGRGGSALSMAAFAGDGDAATKRALHETICATAGWRIEQLQRDKAHLEAQLLQNQQAQLKVMEAHRVALTAAHNQALEHKQAGARFRERVREDERVLRVVSQRETKLRAVIGQLVESVEAFDRDMDEAWEAARRISTDARQVVEGAVDAELTPSLAEDSDVKSFRSRRRT